MKDKKTKNDLWATFRAIILRHPNLTLIEIELKDRDKNLLCKREQFGIGEIKGGTITDIHDYENGKDFFNKLIPIFGKLRVFISEKQSRSFEKFTEFLSKMR